MTIAITPDVFSSASPPPLPPVTAEIPPHLYLDVVEGVRRLQARVDAARDNTAVTDPWDHRFLGVFTVKSIRPRHHFSVTRLSRHRYHIQPLDELQENLRVQLDVGLVLRRLRQENIECKYDAEQLAANQNYLSEKSLAYDTIKADLEDKIRRLEEDKHNVDFSTGLWEQVRLHTAN